MTDRLDELQRLHDAATKGPWTYDRCKRPHSRGGYSVLGPDGSRIFWENYHGDADIEGDDDDVGLVLAMRNALPALLRVARAAAEFADDVFDYRFGGKTPCVDIGQLVSKWIDIRVEITKWSELRAALAELRGTDG